MTIETLCVKITTINDLCINHHMQGHNTKDPCPQESDREDTPNRELENFVNNNQTLTVCRNMGMGEGMKK